MCERIKHRSAQKSCTLDAALDGTDQHHHAEDKQDEGNQILLDHLAKNLFFAPECALCSLRNSGCNPAKTDEGSIEFLRSDVMLESQRKLFLGFGTSSIFYALDQNLAIAIHIVQNSASTLHHTFQGVWNHVHWQIHRLANLFIQTF